MKPKLFIVTGNDEKFKQLSFALKEFFDCEQKVIKMPEIQGNAREILEHKVRFAYENFRQPVLVDDTSLHFEKLLGLPGPYINDFLRVLSAQEMGPKLLGSRLQAISHVALCLGEDKIIIAEGTAEGVVAPLSIIESNRFNWDIFVQIDGTDRPMIEFSTEEKMKFSHRGMAMKNLIEILKKESK